MTVRLKNLEDKEITQLYDDVYSNTETAARNKELAGEMVIDKSRLIEKIGTLTQIKTKEIIDSWD